MPPIQDGRHAIIYGCRLILIIFLIESLTLCNLYLYCLNYMPWFSNCLIQLVFLSGVSMNVGMNERPCMDLKCTPSEDDLPPVPAPLCKCLRHRAIKKSSGPVQGPSRTRCMYYCTYITMLLGSLVISTFYASLEFRIVISSHFYLCYCILRIMQIYIIVNDLLCQFNCI